MFEFLPVISNIEWVLVLSPICCYWTVGIILHICLNLSFFDKYRVHPVEVEDKRNKVKLHHAVPWVIFQHALQICLGYGSGVFDPKSEIADPIYISMIKFFAAMVIIDTYQYWVHRTAHMNKWLYNNFHSWHHRLYCPYPLGALYNHPVEGFFLDTVSGALAMTIPQLDVYTCILFVCFATTKTVFDHCNLDFTYSPLQMIFSNDAVYHDYHHQSIGLK
eukprot:Pgem_evm1s12598